jgi:hypothetical protein
MGNPWESSLSPSSFMQKTEGLWTECSPTWCVFFTSADGTLFSETYNQLNAYFATIPGNYRHNLRRHYLLNSNYADISFLFTIQPGETWNDHLDREYLAVLETDNATPYYLNLHNREVAHTLILGATGAGKSSSSYFFLPAGSFNRRGVTPKSRVGPLCTHAPPA